MPVVPFMRPVTEPPPAGRPIELFLKDGRKRAATTSLVFMGNECFFMWYDAKTRKSITVDEIKGWAPAQPPNPTRSRRQTCSTQTRR